MAQEQAESAAKDAKEEAANAAKMQKIADAALAEELSVLADLEARHFI